MDRANRSTSPMHRRIFLAYRASQEFTKQRQCVHSAYIRTRPDLYIWNFNETLQKAFGQHGVHVPKSKLFIASNRVSPTTGIDLYAQRSKGYPPKDRCVLDDQFAIGGAESMAAYSSLFPDFREFFPYIPFYREGMNGHTNERLLVAHLHYRGVENIEDLPLYARLHVV